MVLFFLAVRMKRGGGGWEVLDLLCLHVCLCACVVKVGC